MSQTNPITNKGKPLGSNPIEGDGIDRPLFGTVREFCALYPDVRQLSNLNRQDADIDPNQVLHDQVEAWLYVASGRMAERLTVDYDKMPSTDRSALIGYTYAVCYFLMDTRTSRGNSEKRYQEAIAWAESYTTGIGLIVL